MKFWEENLKFLKLDKRDLNDIFYTCTKKKNRKKGILYQKYFSSRIKRSHLKNESVAFKNNIPLKWGDRV